MDEMVFVSVALVTIMCLLCIVSVPLRLAIEYAICYL